MKEVSKIAAGVTASTTLAVDSLYKQMKADGLDVVGFGAGEPDFDTPDNIKQAAIKAITAGKTKYTSAAGLLSLREAISKRFAADFGVEYKAAEIVVASGAKHSLFAAVMTLLNPGDEVVVPAPYWVTYTEVVKIAGGVPVAVSAPEDKNFKISAVELEAEITPKTKLFILNNPSNPTGMLYSEDELKSLIDVCVKHDLYILSDEIYSGLVYDGKKFRSVASFGEDVRERTIIINGVSKSYAMTGWRIGYSVSSARLATLMANYLSHSTSAPSTISQIAAEEALSGPQDAVIAMRDVFEKRRDYIFERLNSIEGVSCIKPDGAFYIMVNIKEQIGRTISGVKINSGDDFAMALLKYGHVAMVSCVGFGNPNFLRMTYAESLDNIKEGLDRLEAFLKS